MCEDRRQRQAVASHITPSYAFIAAFPNGAPISAVIMRDTDHEEVELRADQVLQILDEFPSSPSKRDLLHVWFVKLRAQRANLRVAQ